MTRNCNENYYELIGSIVAFPDSAATFSRPFNMERKSDAPSFSVTDRQKKTIPMKPRSGEVKETFSRSVAGESYEVTVTWEVEQVDGEVYALLESLKEEANHLIVKTFPDNGLFVRAVPEGYSFEYAENDGTLSCELVIRNMTGAQRML